MTRKEKCEGEFLARVFVKTYGCTHNKADSERMSGLLYEAGYELVATPTKADVVLVNSCAVKDPAEKKCRHEIAAYRKAGKHVVVAGCLPQGNPSDEELSTYSLVGTKALDQVVNVVERTLAGERVDATSKPSDKPARLDLPRVQKEERITIIPLAEGCLGTCTYCKTVHARGRLQSHPPEEVLSAVERAVKEGAKEVWLTAEDVGAYGYDLHEEKEEVQDQALARLLEEIARLPGEFMVRVGMANPHYILRQLDAILDVFAKHPRRFFHFLHLPVQSGSDNVLKEMERSYTVADFNTVLSRARARLPNITVMNDYIVGYPTETEEDFQATMDLARKSTCRILNINKFYPRPGTRAARLQLLPTKVVATRCKELVTLYESQDPNAGREGEGVKAFFTTTGKEQSIVGHTQNYTQVVLQNVDAKRKANVLGTWQHVTVTRENKYYLTVQAAKNKRV